MERVTVAGARPRSYIVGAVLTLWSSSIGKKAVMAVTGAMLMAFVVVHTFGTLKIFKGQEVFDAYALWLREVGTPLLAAGAALWLNRLVLLAAVSLHMLAAWQLTRQSWAARPVQYTKKESLEATYASRTMRWGGVIIALFVVYHVLHFTVGAVGYGPGQFVHGSVYRNVVLGFSVWYVSAFYIVAMVFLALHLYHAAWSVLHTLGVVTAWGDRAYRTAGAVLAIVVALANISVPVAVLAGVLK
jgi:succinate dehydrogenase / fumarate reductase, cytochrome b subunit